MIRRNKGRKMVFSLVLLAVLFLGGCMDYTGFAVLEDLNQPNLELNDDYNYRVALDGPQRLSSLKMSGSFEGDSAFAYLDMGDSVYTIFNSELIKGENYTNGTISFEDVCVDTCDIDVVAGEYTIQFIVNDANLNVDSFDYDMVSVEQPQEETVDNTSESVVNESEGIVNETGDNETINVSDEIVNESDENSSEEVAASPENTSIVNQTGNLSEEIVNETGINESDAIINETGDNETINVSDEIVNESTDGSNNTVEQNQTTEDSAPSNTTLPEQFEEPDVLENTSQEVQNASGQEEEVLPQNTTGPLSPSPNTTINQTAVNESINVSNATVSDANVSEERTTYYRVQVGKPVKWKKKIMLKEGQSGIRVRLPYAAQNISVEGITAGEKRRIPNDKLRVEESTKALEGSSSDVITGQVVKDIKEGGNFFEFVKDFFEGGATGYAVVDTPAEAKIPEDEIDLVIDEEVEEVEVEYYLPGPTSEEKKISENKKEVMISSEIHYQNVIASTSIKEVPSSAINLYWIKDGKRVRHDFDAYDTNNNGLADYIEWVAPHLSNQTFEVELDILTIQSYPEVGGYWTVEFTTIGQADLEIVGWDGTFFGEDIEHVSLKCDGVEVDADYDGYSVYYPDYECNGTSEHIVEVLTKGEHIQKFDFGGVVGYANNFASNVPNTINLQGKLENSTGGTVSGLHNFTFRLYDVATGGSAEWTEVQNDVNVDSDGIYDVVLGSTTPMDINFSKQYYLGVEVDGDGEMSPRVNLTSSPYAQRAKFADTIDCVDCVSSTEIQNYSVLPIDLFNVSGVSDEDILTYESSGPGFEWHTPGELITAGDYLDWTGATLDVNEVDLNATIDARDEDTAYTAGTGLTLTGTEFSTNDSEIDHNQLTNYNVNEHIDWTDATEDLNTTGTIYSGDIVADGAVGIGTNNPSTTLEVLRSEEDVDESILRLASPDGSDWLEIQYEDYGFYRFDSSGRLDFRAGGSSQSGTLTFKGSVAYFDANFIMTRESHASGDEQYGSDSLGMQTHLWNGSENLYRFGAIKTEPTAENMEYRLDFITNISNVNTPYETGITAMSILNDGNVGIGTTNPDSKLDVVGDIRVNGSNKLYAPEICLNGDCQSAWSAVGYYYNKTSATYTANLSAGGYTGYKAGNYICDQAFTGTHLCYESEIMLTIKNNNISNMPQWSGNAWIMAGGAKYSPADLPVNDCSGFTHGVTGSYLGSFWMFNQTTGGSGGVGHCANSLALACCKEGGIE